MSSSLGTRSKTGLSFRGSPSDRLRINSATEESKIRWQQTRINQYYVYIMTKGMRTLRISVAENLLLRVFESKEKLA